MRAENKSGCYDCILGDLMEMMMSCSGFVRIFNNKIFFRNDNDEEMNSLRLSEKPEIRIKVLCSKEMNFHGND